MTSSSLIDDLSDELLLCRICLEPLRRPKTLSCRHTFCEVCLERLRDSEMSTGDDDDVRLATSRRGQRAAARLSCPVCYESCTLPPGGVCRLPDDPLVAQLCSIIERRKRATTQSGDDGGSERMCDICSSRWSTVGSGRARARTAHLMCVECAKYLCSSCARLHRRTHVRPTFDTTCLPFTTSKHNLSLRLRIQ